MFKVKQTIRYNGVTYKIGQKADFNEEDLKEISNFVEEIEGEPKKEVEVEPIIEEVKENKTKSAKKSTKK